MNKFLILISLILVLSSCSDDTDSITKPPIDNKESIFSLLNINESKKWNYSKQTKFRNDPWIDAEPEYATYEVTSVSSSFFTFYTVSNNESNLVMDLSYDSTSLYMNSFSLGDNFVDPVLKKLDFQPVKIADLQSNDWEIDTLFFNNLVVDDDYSFDGFIAFNAKRTTDSTVIYENKEMTSKRFELEMRIIATQKETNFNFIIFPGYYISLVDNVGIYRVQLKNHTNTALKVEEFDYILQSIEE